MANKLPDILCPLTDRLFFSGCGRPTSRLDTSSGKSRPSSRSATSGRPSTRTWPRSTPPCRRSWTTSRTRSAPSKPSALGSDSGFRCVELCIQGSGSLLWHVASMDRIDEGGLRMDRSFIVPNTYTVFLHDKHLEALEPWCVNRICLGHGSCLTPPCLAIPLVFFASPSASVLLQSSRTCSRTGTSSSSSSGLSVA